MNLRDLQYIVALAEKRHFAYAAEACETLRRLADALEDYLPAGVTPLEN